MPKVNLQHVRNFSKLTSVIFFLSGVGGELIPAGDLLLPGRAETSSPLVIVLQKCPFDAVSVSPFQVCLRSEAVSHFPTFFKIDSNIISFQILGSGAHTDQR